MKENSIILTYSDYFKSNYRKYTAKVAPRPFSSLSFRISGRVSVSATDFSMISLPGALTFTPAGFAYETCVEESGEMLVMHYTLAPGSRDLADRPMTLIPEHPEDFINLFTRTLRRYQPGTFSLDSMADAYRLLAEAKRVFFPALMPYKKLVQIKEYIDQNLWDSQLRVSALSEQFGTSEVYFRREFKKYYELSPSEYIKKRRLETACQLLRSNLCPVAEAAIRSGFDSISYFSAEFRRHFGCSPSEYKKL